ncbi:DsbA family oxidoreductase [Paenibacillus polysaccharolyticus]|uniref:DsbA family oxidoreductase n=1 Tax=Paenibacillus cucumis (ex Kampfer et al. 2016) TaxID=1776858 RepID=A0ABS7KD03_9BACL|nr:MULTISPECIES: DsbA family oxidoreductase [Paenibacillus]MBY0201841.1 DsbA family oxidoreductase [Paenibacillus cucumis (ex Kampfer et al. 2016)]MCM3131673.1 DsbA family oxidoreductase [Paenibacillus polysaccharolyticus]MCP1134840.1 DsbA family oxidoreductase [Paenibacillus polysaccharolyticus]MDP9698726.1 putative DsbA family dithiol-disulfide isomerase [Paenibacillus intestini]
MNIEVWSDFMCPFCYIGKRRLENVLEKFPHRDEVKLQFKSFELDPNAEVNSGKTNVDYLTSKYNISEEQARGMNAQMNANARTAGLEYNIDAMIPTNSFAAHRLTHWADTQGKALDLSERLFHAIFIEGKHVGDPQVLADLAQEVGLDREAAVAVLSSDQYTENVRADQAEGAQLGIRGVPFFVLDRKFAVSGAQPDDVFLDALQKAWDERSPFTIVESNDAASDRNGVCTEEGCEVPQNKPSN